MKKFLASVAVLMVLVPVGMTKAASVDLNVRAAKVGLPFYQEWAWTDNTDTTMRFAFKAGFEGLVQVCEHYLTPANLAAVIKAQAFSPDLMDGVLKGTGQSVDAGMATYTQQQ